jgi:tetratricopeptide (TPR) repeat protein
VTVPPASPPLPADLVVVDHPPAARAARSAAGWRAWVVILLAVAPVLPGLRAAFLYDDTTIIRDNPWLRGWSALLHVWTQPYWPTSGPDSLGLYRPLHIALLALVWNVGGGSALLFHAYAITLAALAALAVWWLARRATGAAAALMAALWFATHPLHVEAIASAANSSELLVVLGTVTLIRLLARHDELDATTGRWRRAIAVGAVAAATLRCKESGLFALPIALLTVWGWRRDTVGASWRGLLRVDRHAITVACVTVGFVLVARRLVLGAAVSRVSIAAAGLELSGADRVATMLSLWPRIAASLVWPSALAPYYGPSIVPSHRAGLALASALVASAAIALAVRLARRGDRRPLVALGWIGLTYFPASNLLVATGQILSDRTLFGATVGVALMLAWALDRVPARARRIAVGLALLLVAHASLVTLRYAVTWTSHRALWRQLIEVEPAEHLGYKLLGMDARARGESNLAVTLLARARTMAPADRQIRFEYGQALYEARKFAEAADELGALLRDEDVRDEPGAVRMYLDAVGRSRGAQAVVDAARPLLGSGSAASAALYTGMAYEQLGRPASADSAYAAGLQASPRDSSLLARRSRR